MKKFEVGKTYILHFDNGHTSFFEVVKRTAKTITMKNLDKIKTYKLADVSTKEEVIYFKGCEIGAMDEFKTV